MRVSTLIFSTLLLSTGCMSNSNSIFRPDFGSQSQNGHTTSTSIAGKAKDQRSAKLTNRSLEEQKEAESGAGKDTVSKLVKTTKNKITGNLISRNLNKGAMSVDEHYRQQLDLHKGDTEPAYRPPPPKKKNTSWLGRVFKNDDTPSSDTLSNCYKGTLNTEGITCQALRTNDGRLITLGGPLRGFGPGDSVCVCGPASATSFCQQGTTIYIARIDVNCPEVD